MIVSTFSIAYTLGPYDTTAPDYLRKENDDGFRNLSFMLLHASIKRFYASTFACSNIDQTAALSKAKCLSEDDCRGPARGGQTPHH